MTSSNTVNEFIIKAPSETNKTYNVMRFNGALKVDVGNWKQAKMIREGSTAFKEAQALGALKPEKDAVEKGPKFGAGSEFGKDEREEARRKRYERYQRKYNPDTQPWLLKVGGKDARKYKGIREGGVTENASYYVFFQAPDGAFEAHPIKEWYNFTPVQRFKPLSAEEAEEKFEQRHKILNLFSVMKSKDSENGGEGDEGEGKKKGRRGDFKVTDMDDWGMGSDAELGSDEDGSGDDSKSKKKKGKGKKKKKKGSDDSDSEAKEESDEGDWDDKELDYMSDSSSDDEFEEEKEPEDDLKGVADEDALRQLALTDSSDEEEENKDKEGEGDGDAKKSGDPNAPGTTKDAASGDKGVKVKSEPKSISDSSSSSSDDSDLDESKFTSSIFMQKKINEMKAKGGASDGGSGSSSRAATPTTASSTASSGGAMKDESDSALAGTKRKLSASGYESGNGSGAGPSGFKKQKSGEGDEGITEDAVRRYLMRKPMTTTELLQKFRSKNKKMTKQDTDRMVTLVAQILKKLKPDQQKIKDKLYLSLKP